jgi:hypothetical protein
LIEPFTLLGNGRNDGSRSVGMWDAGFDPASAKASYWKALVVLTEPAGLMKPDELCTLDAIHLATAALLETTLSDLVTYDLRLAVDRGVAGLIAPGIRSCGGKHL